RLSLLGSGNTQAQWDAVHDAASGNADYTSANRTLWVGSLLSGGSIVMLRGYLPFDTSALPANAIITDATLGVYVIATQDNANDGNDFVSVVQGLQASPQTLTGTDYAKAGDAVDNPTEGSNRLDITNLTLNAYKTWTLNSAGISWIVPGGVSQFAVREG